MAELLGDGTAKLWRISDWTQLGSTYTIPSFSLSTWYTLGLRANGSQISLEINGSAVIGPVTDSTFTSGDVGVWSYAPSATGTHRFDNWSITLLGGGQRSAKALAKAAPRQLRAISAPPTGRAYRVYYLVNGRALAMRELAAGDVTGVLYYLHSDHLGSTSAATCGVPTGCGAAGGYQSVVSQQWYLPYGAVRASTGAMPTDQGFTGQFKDNYSKLIILGARWYDPELGRFVSADSIVPQPYNPQSLNRYAYTMNDPIRYSDSSGHSRECGIGDPGCKAGKLVEPEVPNTPPHGMGSAGYAGILALASQTGAWWGDILDPLEAVAIVLRYEVSTAMYLNDGEWNIDPTVIEAITRKYNQFCSDGAWSASCFSGFWGYYQPILDSATSKSQLREILNEDLYKSRGGVFIKSARQVIGNRALGGQRDDRPSGWVTLYFSNGTTYDRARALTQGSASNQVYDKYVYPPEFGDRPPIFLVLSVDQQKNLCGGTQCNLTKSR